MNDGDRPEISEASKAAEFESVGVKLPEGMGVGRIFKGITKMICPREQNGIIPLYPLENAKTTFFKKLNRKMSNFKIRGRARPSCPLPTPMAESAVLSKFHPCIHRTLRIGKNDIRFLQSKAIHFIGA